MSNSRPAFTGLLVVLLLATGAGLYLYPLSAGATFKLAMAGSRSTSDGIAVSGGNVFVEAPQPGVYFGTFQTPGEAEQFSYLVLFKYAAPNAGHHGHGITFNSGINGRVVRTNDAINIEGRSISADFRLDLDEARRTIERETLVIGGKSVDPQAGRVFLFDMTAPTPLWVQKKIELPAVSSAFGSATEVEAFVKTLREKLRGADPQLDEYLK